MASVLTVEKSLLFSLSLSQSKLCIRGEIVSPDRFNGQFECH